MLNAKAPIPPGNRLEALKEAVKDSTEYGSTGSGGSALCGNRMELTMSKSSITTQAKMPEADIDPLKRPAGGWKLNRVKSHPGAILREDFLKELKVSGNELALRIGVPATRIHEILNERRSISPDTAMRLGVFFAMSADIWLRLQAAHDLSKVAIEKGALIKRVVRPLARGDAAA